MDKKRHHYVPKAYLKSFCDEQGQVYVYLKDNPDKVIHQSPDNTGFHKYYYSQPLPGGGRDTNTLENLFAELETKWPPLVERMIRRDNVNSSLDDLFAFIGLQRARVPASRDRALVAEVTAHVSDCCVSERFHAPRSNSRTSNLAIRVRKRNSDGIWSLDGLQVGDLRNKGRLKSGITGAHWSVIGESMKPSTTDQIKGKMHEVKGAVKQTAGQVTNNPNLEAEGQGEKLAGKVQTKVGQIEKVLEK